MLAGRWTRLCALAAAAVAVVSSASSSSSAADVRVRRSWAAHSEAEKALFVGVVEQAMASGEHLRFARLYMAAGGLDAVVNTCGAPAWYRKFLLGYENMLRAQDVAGAANVTLPYWDVFEDAAKRISAQTACSSIQDCSPFLADMGGCGGPDVDAYAVDGVAASGRCANTSVAASACIDSANCEGCLARGDWDIDGSSLEFGPTALVDALRLAGANGSNSSAVDALRASIQANFQLSVHSVLGGVYETRAAAFDPIFLGHYATIDLVYQLFQSCNESVALTGTCEDNNGSAISPSATIPTTLDGVAIEDDAALGAYFSGIGTTYAELSSQDVQYELDAFLQQLMSAFSLECSSTTTSIALSAEESTYEDADELEDLVDALASCATSTVNGTTQYQPYAFMTCELLSSLQNGVFTNFSTPVREFFRASADDLPQCVDALAAEATGEVSIAWSSDCVDDVSTETSIDTDAFATLTSGFAVVTLGNDGGIVFLNPTS